MTLEGRLPSEVLTLARVFGLSRALESAMNIEAWEKAKNCCSFGKKLSDAMVDDLLSEVVRIAFEAEASLIAHFMGDTGEAGRLFPKVLDDLEKFTGQKYQQFRVLHRKFAHMAAWVSHALNPEPFTSGKEPKSQLAKPVSGWFSNIENLPEEVMERPAPPYSLTWNMLAIYAAWGGQKDIVENCAQRAMVETPEGQYYLAVLKAWEALFIIQLAVEEFDLAFYSGLQYARLFVLAYESRKKSEVWDPIQPMDLKTKVGEIEPVLAQESGESVTSLVLEPIFMALCSVEKLPKIDFGEWARHMEGILGPGNDSASTLSWVEMGVHAIFGEEPSIAKIREDIRDTSRLPERFRRLGMLFRCASMAFPVNDNLSAQSSMLLQFAVPFRGTIWTAAFCRMVAKRWRYLVEHQRFMLGSPTLSAPEILKVASLPNPKVSECANLLLIVAEGINVRWPDELFRALRELGKSR